MHELPSVRELSSWSADPVPETFPYDAVVEHLHHVGKHFAAPELLDVLVEIRATLAGGADDRPLLASFLDAVLDKRDGRYDYLTYLALDLLALPGTDEPVPRPDQVAEAQRRHDRLVTGLTADTLVFELAALDGSTTLFPVMRPDAVTATKRLRLALRAVWPALVRCGLSTDGGPDSPVDPADPVPDPVPAARRMCAEVVAGSSPAERRSLRLSILPVWVAHDEYMFIRVLQTFETTFALLVVRLRAAVAALGDGDPVGATDEIEAADAALRETSRWFSLLATMQVASFREFRQYTEGASAIQSRNYKLVESLCGAPEDSRLESAAYLSVPDVRAHLLARTSSRPTNLIDALRAIGGADGPAADKCDELVATMRRFESTLVQWRQTHYRLAVRMLGDRSGTGYTEGTPYLRDVRSIPVFPGIDQVGQR